MYKSAHLELIKYVGITILLCGTLFFSCNNDDETGNDQQQKTSQISDFKTQLETLHSENNLLLAAANGELEYQLTFETGEELLIPLELINDIQLDQEEWRAVFSFCDDTSLEIDYQGAAFEIADSNVVLNPFEIAPLSVLASFTTPVKGLIKTRVLGKGSSGITFEKEHEAFGESHEVPILGLYQNYTNTVEIIFTDQFGRERNKQTFMIPTERIEYKAVIEVLVNELPDEEQNNLYLTSVTPGAYDTQGELRWWLNQQKYRAYPTADGDLMIQLTGDRQAENGRLELITKMGEILKTYTIPNGVHHEVWQKEKGGNFILGSSIGGTEPGFSFQDDDTEDLIVEIDYDSGEIVKEWDMKELFDFERERFWYELDNDWFHLNSIAYDPNDNTLLISSRHQAFVAKIGYDDKEVKWILGTHERWTSAHSDKLLEPLNFDTSVHPDQDWTYGQHSARVTQDGNILIYDNGMDRLGFDPDGIYNKAGGYVRAVEYKVDENNMTVEKTWEHIPYDQTVWSKAVGSIEEKANGNILQGHGITSNNFRQYLEVERSGKVIYQARFYDTENFYRVYSFSFD